MVKISSQTHKTAASDFHSVSTEFPHAYFERAPEIFRSDTRQDQLNYTLSEVGGVNIDHSRSASICKRPINLESDKVRLCGQTLASSGLLIYFTFHLDPLLKFCQLSLTDQTRRKHM